MKSHFQLTETTAKIRDRPIEVVVERQHELSRGALLDGKSLLRNSTLKTCKPPPPAKILFRRPHLTRDTLLRVQMPAEAYWKCCDTEDFIITQPV